MSGENIDKTWNKITHFSRHTLDSIKIPPKFAKRANGVTIHEFWTCCINEKYTTSDILMLYKLSYHYKNSVVIKLSVSDFFTTSQIKYVISKFLYKRKCNDEKWTRERQRQIHDTYINMYFRVNERDEVKKLIYDVRDRFDKLQSIKDVVKFYKWLCNPTFDIKFGKPGDKEKNEVINKIHIRIIDNAYFFAIRDTGEDQSVCYFLKNSHKKATKKPSRGILQYI